MCGTTACPRGQDGSIITGDIIRATEYRIQCRSRTGATQSSRDRLDKSIFNKLGIEIYIRFLYFKNNLTF